MRPIRLTNRELQEILQNMRTQLKHERSATGTVSVAYKLNPISSDDKAPSFILIRVLTVYTHIQPDLIWLLTQTLH